MLTTRIILGVSVLVIALVVAIQTWLADDLGELVVPLPSLPTATATVTGESETQPDLPQPGEEKDPRCIAGIPGASLALSGRTIIIDPGHGGDDLGTINAEFELQETDLTPVISAVLRDRLLADGARVCLTRITDANLSLAERAEFANEQQGDAFVSVHLNHLDDPEADYTMALYGNRAKDVGLAESVLSALAAELSTPESYDGLTNPIAEQEPLLEELDSSMLRNVEMPAVLVEGVFLSNNWEANAFASGIADGTRWRERQIATAIHQGVLDFFAAVRG